IPLELAPRQIGDAHHLRRHEPLADAFRGHEQPIRAEPDADVAVVGCRVAARIHAPADFHDVGAQRGVAAHAVRPSTGPPRDVPLGDPAPVEGRARYLSRHASEQKNRRLPPTLSTRARSGRRNVPQTGSRTIWTPWCATSRDPSRGRPDTPATMPSTRRQNARPTMMARTRNRISRSITHRVYASCPARQRGAPTAGCRARAWPPAPPDCWARARLPPATPVRRRRGPACRTL